jgi:D-galactarolactone cycloisomerase
VSPLEAPIQDVSFWGTTVPLTEGERFTYAQGPYNERFATIVSVEAGGVRGWGEALSPPALTVESVGLIARRIVGRPVRDGLAEVARAVTEYGDFGRNGLFMRATSAVVNALVDLRARALGVSTVDLLGGVASPTIQGYATGFFRREPDESDVLLQEMNDRVSEGFNLLKLKGGFGIARDVALVRSARRELGDGVRLAFDVNRAYSEREAARLARDLEEYDIEWLEEPTSPDAASSYSRLRLGTVIPLSAGESFNRRSDFLTFFQAGALDIAQPNVGVVGGLLEAQRVAAIAHAFNVEVVPHSWGTEIALAASLSLCVLLEPTPGRLVAPMPLVEVDCSPNPLRGSFAHLEWERSRDMFTYRNAVGHGVAVHENELQKLADAPRGIAKSWTEEEM